MKESTFGRLPADITLLSASESNSPAIRYARSRGALVRAADRVVMPRSLADEPRAWIRAIHSSNPDLIVTGRAALCCTKDLDPVFPIPVIVSGSRVDTAQVSHLRTALPRNLVISTESGTCTIDEISVLVCAEFGDDETTCDALRLGWVTLSTLNEAASMLPGNSRLGRVARTALADLSGNPWSVAELRLHRLLRNSGVGGWVGNQALHLGDGQQRHPDVGFMEQGVLVEVDGVEFHSGPDAVEKDKRRVADFMRAGWRVVVLTPSMVTEDPDGVVDLIRLQLASQRIRDRRRDQCLLIQGSEK